MNSANGTRVPPALEVALAGIAGVGLGVAFEFRRLGGLAPRWLVPDAVLSFALLLLGVGIGWAVLRERRSLLLVSGTMFLFAQVANISIIVAKSSPQLDWQFVVGDSFEALVDMTPLLVVIVSGLYLGSILGAKRQTQGVTQPRK